ncbi:MAG: DUF4175 family protein [bacterium]
MTAIKSSADLYRHLKKVLFKQRAVMFTAGLLTTVAVLVLTILILTLVAAVMIVPVWLKLSLLVLATALTLVLLARLAVGRMFFGSVETVAVRLETKYPDLKGRLIAAIQFARMKKTPGFSAELMALTEQQALRQATLVNFNQVLSFYPLLRNGRLFILSAALAVVMVLALPGLFNHSFEVYSHPTLEIAPPLGYRVVPFPESTEWVKYRDIRIGAAIIGDGLPDKAVIHYRLAGGNWQRNDIDLRQQKLFPTPGGDSVVAATTLRQVARSFDYYVEAGRIKSDPQKIDVVDRPRVTGIKLSIFYPDYTELPPTVIDENNGSFSALVGSRVNMRVTTNLPVEQANLIYTDSSVRELKIEDKWASSSLLIEKSQTYFVRLVDHLGERNPDPIEYYITAVPDEYPSVDVLRPGFDVNLNDDMQLPLKVRIFDDFGFSSLMLKYQLVSHGQPSEEHVAVLHFSERIKTEGEVEFNWDMDRLNLYPGDFVVYYFEVADNDRLSGPKLSRSRQYVARLPSLDEMIAETEAESSERVSRTEQLYQQGKELTQRLKNTARKIKAQSKQTRNTDWQQQKELEAIVEDNSRLVDKIEDMARQMEQSVDKLQQTSMMSREVMEKLAQIQKLYEEVATPEMREAQRRLMEALQKMDRAQVEKAMQEFKMSQEELLERLERTLALLKRMQVQQKMEAMLRQAEQLLQQQQEMNDKSQAASTEQLPPMADTEKQLQSALKDLKTQTQELSDLAHQAEMDDATEVKKFNEAVEKSDADQNMEKMSQALAQQKKEQAGREGKVAQAKLSEMVDQMQQELLALKGGDQEEIRRAMRMAIDDANYLSQRQEELLKQAAMVDPRSIVLRDLASSQQDLASSCQGLKNRISQLGKESPFVAAELQKLVQNAISNMQQATDGFDCKQGGAAMRQQHDAMVDLNRAAIRMMESLDQQKECDKGGKCDKNMSKLQSMCNKQNQINQQTKECNKGGQCNKPGNKPGDDGRQGSGGFERLAAEQGAVRKSLQQLADEFNNSRQILGRLDDIGREMKLVEEDLADGEVGQETIQRQLKIYSRMLQATRSLQRKDYSEQRRAKTAEEQLYHLPSPLPASLLDDHINLEDRLRHFLGENYPPQYEQQIKAYFKALLQFQSIPGQSDQSRELTP